MPIQLYGCELCQKPYYHASDAIRCQTDHMALTKEANVDRYNLQYDHKVSTEYPSRIRVFFNSKNGWSNSKWYILEDRKVAT